jgi:hypothetical protein
MAENSPNIGKVTILSLGLNNFFRLFTTFEQLLTALDVLAFVFAVFMVYVAFVGYHPLN